MYSDQMEAEQAFSGVLNSHKCGTSSGVAWFLGGGGGGGGGGAKGKTPPFSQKIRGEKS